MFVGCPIAQIVNVDIDNFIFLRSLHHALAERRAADLWKQSQDVDFHERRTFNVQRSTSNAQCLTNQSGGSSSPCSMPKMAARPRYFLTSPAERPIHPPTSLGRARNELFHDLESGALAVTCRRAGKKRANGVNGLAVAADDSANVALAQL